MTSTPKIHLSVKSLRKNFDSKLIFKDIGFELSNSSSLAITGRNGSGKSTLLKILANLLSASSGSVKFEIDNKTAEQQDYYNHIGFAAPYLNLYDEFSGLENLKILSQIRGLQNCPIEDSLKKVGLYERRNDLLKIYSSGMKQRLKIAFAILHNPYILFLDEPSSNLDNEGINIITTIVEEFKKERIVVIATNDDYEKKLCTQEINLDNQ